MKIATQAHKPYIVPTLYGIAYFFLILNVFALAYYRHSPPFHTVGLTLGILGLVAMIQTNNGMRGLTCTLDTIDMAEEGGTCPLQIALKSQQKEGQFNLLVDVDKDWSTGESVFVPFLKGSQSIRLDLRCNKRGLYHLKRIKVSTRGLFGLFYAWIWLNLDAEILVYPQPQGQEPLPLAVGEGEGEGEGSREHGDDFIGHQAFQMGNSLKRVDWKVFARTNKMLIKDFQGEELGTVCLDRERVIASGIENQLRQLSAWAFLCAEQNRNFSLRLDAIEIDSYRGKAHLQEILRTLATYGEA